MWGTDPQPIIWGPGTHGSAFTTKTKASAQLMHMSDVPKKYKTLHKPCSTLKHVQFDRRSLNLDFDT